MYLYDLQMRILFSVSDFFKFIHIFQVILLWVIFSEFLKNYSIDVVAKSKLSSIHNMIFQTEMAVFHLLL